MWVHTASRAFDPTSFRAAIDKTVRGHCDAMTALGRRHGGSAPAETAHCVPVWS